MSPPNRPPSIAAPSESESTDRSSADRWLSRRPFVAAGATTALVSLAGCSAVVNFFGDLALQDVNVFNGADQSVSGSIEMVDPNGEAVLEETFDLEKAPEDEGNSTEDESTVQYEGVWTDAGDYEVTVTLDEPVDGTTGDTGNSTNATEPSGNESLSNETATDRETGSSDGDSNASADAANGTAEGGAAPIGPSRTDAVTVDNTDEQKLVIGIAQDGPAELISYHVIEDLSELEAEFEQ